MSNGNVDYFGGLCSSSLLLSESEEYIKYERRNVKYLNCMFESTLVNCQLSHLEKDKDKTMHVHDQEVDKMWVYPEE